MHILLSSNIIGKMWSKIEGLRFRSGKNTKKGWYFKRKNGEEIYAGETIYQAQIYLQEHFPEEIVWEH